MYQYQQGRIYSNEHIYYLTKCGTDQATKLLKHHSNAQIKSCGVGLVTGYIVGKLGDWALQN